MHYSYRYNPNTPQTVEEKWCKMMHELAVFVAFTKLWSYSTVPAVGDEFVRKNIQATGGRGLSCTITAIPKPRREATPAELTAAEAAARFWNPPTARYQGD